MYVVEGAYVVEVYCWDVVDWRAKLAYLSFIQPRERERCRTYRSTTRRGRARRAVRRGAELQIPEQTGIRVAALLGPKPGTSLAAVVEVFLLRGDVVRAPTVVVLQDAEGVAGAVAGAQAPGLVVRVAYSRTQRSVLRTLMMMIYYNMHAASKHTDVVPQPVVLRRAVYYRPEPDHSLDQAREEQPVQGRPVGKHADELHLECRGEF